MFSVLVLLAVSGFGAAQAAETKAPVKVFILAGDENCLEQGVIASRTEGLDFIFFPNEKPEKDEMGRHVNCSIYKGEYKADADYDKLTADATGLVALGESQAGKKKSKLFTPYPDLALKEGYTTVLHGYLTVLKSGQYEIRPGADESAFNVTTVDGQEVWRREVGQAEAKITPVQLKAKKRYPFKAVFFRKPGYEFRVPQVNRPGSLMSVVAEKPKYAFLKDKDGKWTTRTDVSVFDMHPLWNNTKTPGHYLQVGDVPYGDRPARNLIGPELMLGTVLGEHFDQPVLIARFAVQQKGSNCGSRSLGNDYLSPSSGATTKMDGGWDVIHFNWGVWDATYHDKASKYNQGHGNTTSVADYENNLRTLVARLKKTGATLIFANTTPVWEGEPDQPNGDVNAFNAVAKKVMEENGVIYEDLNAEVRRQGHGKSHNVHDVGNLAPLVTKDITDALAARKQNSKPFPRVLLIGDSITGTYQAAVIKNLDGKAACYKNPGNGESTWTGLRRLDDWIDLKQYLLSGEDYMELVDGWRETLKRLDRVIPGYQGQGVELAGLIWFQGILDSFSPSQTKDYEKNLANLIRDLRKDFEAPKLPVVVAALGVPESKVRAAHMAVGDEAKYPEFAGNVLSFDTKPFFHPVEQTPGGRTCHYSESAESFLEIGEAMGHAMLALTKDKK